MVKLACLRVCRRTWKEPVLALRLSQGSQLHIPSGGPRKEPSPGDWQVYPLSLCEPLHFLSEYLPTLYQPPATLP